LLSVSARVPGRYQISGRLVDVDGQPLAGFRVSVGDCPTCRVFSQTDGSFSLGPFRDLDTYLLAVTDDNQTGVIGAFYDFRSDTLRATSAFPLEIVMIGNHGISSECGSAYGGHFLDFLRGMSRTVAPRFTLNRWATYPIPYWVQNAVSTGVWTGALDAVVHAAATAWNDRCAELPEMFVPAVDSASAAVVVKFAVLSSGLYGFVVMTRPFLGAVNEDIPETIHVTIHQQLNSEAFARGLALHELGHALCLGGHSECSLHIMTTGGHPVPTDQTLADALHPDEVLAARYVRQLPQGQDMRQYLRE
jgi:hypothetical protein